MDPIYIGVWIGIVTGFVLGVGIMALMRASSVMAREEEEMEARNEFRRVCLSDRERATRRRRGTPVS